VYHARFPFGAARQPRGRVGSRVRSTLKGTGAIIVSAHGLGVNERGYGNSVLSVKDLSSAVFIDPSRSDPTVNLE